MRAPYIMVTDEDMRELLNDLKEVREQRDWLQARCTELLEEKRAIDRRAMVKTFHRAMGQPVLLVPQVPSDERVRLRLRLIAEEVFETFDAALVDREPYLVGSLKQCYRETMALIDSLPVHVRLPEFIDGCADTDYVVEGTRLEFGVDGGPVALEVQRANMAKLGGEVRPDGKILKPKDWTGPDIEGELVKQGWTK